MKLRRVVFSLHLRVDPPVFEHLVNTILVHPVFHNNSNNPQLPVPHHDAVIHFDPLYEDDQIEREWAKMWVEEQTCPEWRGGFLCIDGTPFNLFQKPGWHGEGFYDCKSNYSLSAQVCYKL
ncbi:uncharacterized protein EDB93DRAFT_1239541 [Suillus bovinus]|uniref:uncharacterized protein n=1 Tax=Suillus bovinus TaxID=48563 RepID=UPI001B871C20|nr:uncharacterized protein EDB93DRAFT_1239541 [Suillus bovinus]KAG2154156.1 hypothetical protein EDB93DRAFT_1239541 [Suillus bovinus]